ncbi:MAG: chemotaxis protein CheB [candidate division WOR-3 bacterium]
MRVLVVDDSPFVRGVVKSVLSKEGFEVLTASSVKEGIEMLNENPDLIILDIHLPDGEGFEILKYYPPEKVLVFSSDKDIALRALELGVLDFLPKPQHPGDMAKVVLLAREVLFPEEGKPLKIPTAQKEKFRPEIVLVGASSGSPKSLIKIFSEKKVNIPVIICLHIQKYFAESFAERLGAKVIYPEGGTISVDKYLLYPSTNYRFVSKYTIKEDKTDTPFKPSVDIIFSSAAKFFKDKTLGIILSGIGKDGQKGAMEIKNFNGKVLAQDKRVAPVWGMPSAVVGIADEFLTDEGIIKSLEDWGVF